MKAAVFMSNNISAPTTTLVPTFPGPTPQRSRLNSALDIQPPQLLCKQTSSPMRQHLLRGGAGGGKERSAVLQREMIPRFPFWELRTQSSPAKLSATRLRHQACGLGSLSKTPPGDAQSPSQPGAGCWVFLLQGDPEFLKSQ